MKVWLLGHYYPENNMGDEAIHRQVMADIKSIRPNAEFVGENDNPGILILGGGGMYSDWQPEAFDTWLPPIERANREKIPVVAYGIGVGPLFNSQKKARLQTALADAGLIMVRDEFSKTALDLPNTIVTGDPAVRFQNQKLTVGLNMVNIKTIPGLEEFGIELVQYLSGLFNIKLFSFWKSHLAFAIRIAHAANPVSTIIDASDPLTAVTEIRKMDYWIGMQLHGCIFAVMNGIKTLSLSYHPKCCEFAKIAGIDEVILGDGKNLPAENLSVVLQLVKTIIERDFPQAYLQCQSQKNVKILAAFLKERRMI